MIKVKCIENSFGNGNFTLNKEYELHKSKITCDFVHILLGEPIEIQGNEFDFAHCKFLVLDSNEFYPSTCEETRHIKDWEELKEVMSPTHILDIDLRYGCGWIKPKEGEGELGVDTHYLSTHTFYGSNHKLSTQLLQACGFNVVLANWDEEITE